MVRTPQPPVLLCSALVAIAMQATIATAGSGTRPRVNYPAGNGTAPPPPVGLDQSLWEYRGKLEKGTLAADQSGDNPSGDKEKSGSDQASIAGTLRLQQGGVFAIGDAVRSPGAVDFDPIFADFRKSRAENHQSPLIASDEQPQRVGAYKLGKSSRLTLTLDDASEDPAALRGVMALRARRGSSDVFIGNFREKQGKKTVRTWQMILQRAP